MSIKKIILSNGITVINDRRNISTAAFYFSIKTGSANETKHYGISHLTEHLMFKSTFKRTAQQINQEIKNTGAISNASTGYGSTNFWFESLSKYFETVLDVYADFLTHKNISDEEFQKEKDVVLQEIAMYKDDFDSTNLDNLFKNAFGLQPVGGLTKTVEKITKINVLDYVKHCYTPENTVISVCSKFSHRKIKHLMEKYFGNISSESILPTYNSTPEKKMSTQFKKTIGKTRRIKKPELFQTKFSMILPLETDISIKRYITRNILMQIMCHGLSSTMYKELREEQGLFYRMTADMFNRISSFKQPFVIIETSTESKNIKKLTKGINNILINLDSYINEKDVQRAKNIMEMQNVKDTAYDFAGSNLMFFNDYNEIHSDKFYDKIVDSITLQDILKEAKTWAKYKPIVQLLG